MYSKMSFKELQAKALALVLKTYGKNDDIIKRINIFEAKKLKTTYVDQCKTWIKLIVKRKWIHYWTKKKS